MASSSVDSAVGERVSRAATSTTQLRIL